MVVTSCKVSSADICTASAIKSKVVSIIGTIISALAIIGTNIVQTFFDHIASYLEKRCIGIGSGG